MIYNLGDLTITEKDITSYKESAIGKIYAVLCVYEDCEKTGNYESYLVYLKRIINEFSGVYKLFGAVPFISIVGNLKELYDTQLPTHDDVKSVAFHCISEIRKARVVF